MIPNTKDLGRNQPDGSLGICEALNACGLIYQQYGGNESPFWRQPEL